MFHTEAIKKYFLRKVSKDTYTIVFTEPRAQASNRSLRYDGDAGTRRMGGLETNGPEAAMVLHRRRAGATSAPQAHTTPLLATAQALQTEQERRPR